MSQPIELIDLPRVLTMTGLRKSTIYALAKRGDFPAPAKLGAASRWSRAEVEGWIAARLAERTAA